MVDVNKPIENLVFVETMEVLQKNPSQENEAAFLHNITEAQFLMVLQNKLEHDIPDEGGKVVLQKDTAISFPMLSDEQGQPVYFGFTDWSALHAWRNEPNQQAIVFPFSDLAWFILNGKTRCSGFLINPNTHNLFIPCEILAQLNKAASYTVEKQTQVLLGEPRDYPHDMVLAVKKSLKPMKAVKRAWLMHMTKDGEQSYLIVVEHSGEQAEIIQAIGQTAAQYLSPGMFVDIVTTEQDFGKDAVKGRSPFFKRGLSG